jgi:hypothetical protein
MSRSTRFFPVLRSSLRPTLNHSRYLPAVRSLSDVTVPTDKDEQDPIKSKKMQFEQNSVIHHAFSSG